MREVRGENEVFSCYFHRIGLRIIDIVAKLTHSIYFNKILLMAEFIFQTILVFVFFIAIFLTFYFRFAATLHGFVIFFLWVGYIFIAGSHWLWDASVAAVLVAIFAIVCVDKWRMCYLSTPLYRFFRRNFPRLSDTEKQAIESGGVWWEAELFSGAPAWKKLLNEKPAQLSDEEKVFLEGPVEDLCAMADDWNIHHECQDLPPEVWDFLRKGKFLAMMIPKSYGGLEFSPYAHSRVVAKIASRSVALAVTVMVPNSLGPAALLLEYGTEGQKNHYLPRLASAEDIPCFALTSPEAGSDAGSIPDVGIVCKCVFDGKEVLGVKINWDKRYITLAPVATLIGLAFCLRDPDRLLDDGKETVDRGITLALIPASIRGVSVARHLPMGIAFMNGPVRGKDVFIPLEWIIGGTEQIGKGWSMLMQCLTEGRATSLPALSVAATKFSAYTTALYAQIRHQFSLPIIRFEGVREALAQILGNAYLLDATRTMTSMALQNGYLPSVASAIIKHHATERARASVNHAMDIHAGAAIVMGPRNVLGRIYQSMPISITVEGANILTRSLMIFGQGVMRCHPYILEELATVNQANVSDGSVAFDRILVRHVRHVMRNIARCLIWGFGGKFLIKTADALRDTPTHRWARDITYMSSVFAVLTDISLLLYNGSLKRRERLSARLGDMLSYLYMASAVVKFYHDKNAKAGTPLAEWAMEECKSGFTNSLRLVLNNLPPIKPSWMTRLLKWTLTWSLFPALQERHGKDEHDDKLIDAMTEPQMLQDSLCDDIYISKEGRLSILRTALTKINKLRPVARKIKDARKAGILGRELPFEIIAIAKQKGIVNDEEAKLWEEMDVWRKEVLKVDEFPLS